jgi:hypothetical protein
MTYRQFIKQLQDQYPEHLDDQMKLESSHDNALYSVFCGRVATKDSPSDDIKEDDLILVIENFN